MTFSNIVCTAALLLISHSSIIHVNAADYKPPSNAEKFLPVLSRAKLQSPTSSSAVYDLMGYATQDFQLTDHLNFMQFRMSGRKRRTELRQMRADGEEESWSVNDHHCMRAVVAIPEQDPKMERFIFLQVLCSDGDGNHVPAVKVYWNSESRNGEYLVEVGIRDGTGDDDSTTYPLMYIDQGRSEFVIDVNDAKVSIFHGEDNVFQESLRFFADGRYGCYFKAGVYVQQPDDRDVYARSKFFELDWY